MRRRWQLGEDAARRDNADLVRAKLGRQRLPSGPVTMFIGSRPEVGIRYSVILLAIVILLMNPDPYSVNQMLRSDQCKCPSAVRWLSVSSMS